MNLVKTKIFKNFFQAVVILVIGNFLISCQKNIEPANPTCEFTSPSQGDEFIKGTTILLSIAIESDGLSIDKVTYYKGFDDLIASTNDFPYSLTWDTSNEKAGNKSLRVKVTFSNKEETDAYLDIKIVEELPIADFSITYNTNYIPLNVSFIDKSLNSPDTWVWNFGDKSTSTEQNPTYEYSELLGAYTVKLIAANSAGSDTLERVIEVNYNSGNCENCETGTISDYDGNIYKTVKIGNQWWMAENMKTIHYSDGREIRYVQNSNDWLNLNHYERAYCKQEYGDEFEINYKGNIYSYGAAVDGQNYVEWDDEITMIQGVCPTGWHIPDDDDWYELEDYITENSNIGEWDVGKYLGATYSFDWKDMPTLDTYGFSAMVNYMRYPNGNFMFGNHCSWWSSSPTRITQYGIFLHNVPHYFNLHFEGYLNLKNFTVIDESASNYGLAVRCVKD